MKISDKLYDILKWVVIIVLPAVATLYAAGKCTFVAIEGSEYE